MALITKISQWTTAVKSVVMGSTCSVVHTGRTCTRVFSIYNYFCEKKRRKEKKIETVMANSINGVLKPHTICVRNS